MGKDIIVDFEVLDYANYALSKNANEWSDNSADILDAINAFIESDSLTGEGSKSIKAYFGNVHSTIVQSLTLLLQTHVQNLLMYKVDYQNNIDTATSAYIPCDELEEIKNNLEKQYQNSLCVDENIDKAISHVSYLINLSALKLDYIEQIYSQIKSDLQTLNDDISELEERHSKNDFTETRDLTDSLTSLINEYLPKDKTVKNSFDVGVMKSSATYKTLESAKKAVISKQLKRSNELNAAYDSEVAHMKRLNEESNKDVKYKYDNFLNENISSSQMENYLENYRNTILDIFPNAKIDDEYEIPITPSLSAYYKISETLKGDVPVDLNYVVKDQQLELKSFNFTQELGSETSFDIDTDGEIGFSNKKTIGNNTYEYTHSVNLIQGITTFESSVTTDLEKGSVSSIVGLKKSNDIKWRPQPISEDEAIPSGVSNWTFWGYMGNLAKVAGVVAAVALLIYCAPLTGGASAYPIPALVSLII